MYRFHQLCFFIVTSPLRKYNLIWGMAQNSVTLLGISQKLEPLPDLEKMPESLGKSVLLKTGDMNHALF